MGIAQAVPLPGTGDGQIAGLQPPALRIGGEGGLAVQKITDFNSFIPVKRKAPGLPSHGIPDPNRPQPRQAVRSETEARILSAAKSGQGYLPSLFRQHQRAAIIRLIDTSGRILHVYYFPRTGVNVKTLET